MRHGPKALTLRFVLSLALVAQVFLLSGACVLAQEKPDPSIRVTESDPLLRGLTALQENRLEEALTQLSAAERERPQDARVRNFRGIVLVRLGRNQEAANEYREAIRLDPNFADGYKNLGFLEWTERNLESARSNLQRASAIAPDDSFTHYYLGRVELDAGRYESAFQELDLSKVEWPEDAPFLIEAANGYLALGQQEKARELIERLATMKLNDTEVGVVARLLLAEGDKATAIGLLRRLSERQTPAAPRWARFDLALSYLMDGNYEIAAAQSQKFLEASHGSQTTPAGEAASAWCSLGIAKARLGQSVDAVSAFRQASKLDPGREEYWLNLTRELMELNRYVEAISAAQEGLKSNPRSYALHLRLGAAYLSSDRYSDAETVFRQLVSAGDPLATSYIGLAQVLLRTGRADEAVSELAAAGKKLGPNFLISYFQGLALNRAARPAEAISAFRDAVQLSPNSAEAHLGLGKTELQVGRPNEAIGELEKALQLSPGNVQAQRLLGQAYRRAGNAQPASHYSQHDAEEEPAPKHDLLGDFILPEWRSPEPSSRQP